MFLKRSGKALMLLPVLLAAGCSSTHGGNNLFPAAGDNPIAIESDPPGAEVYVMGEKLGVTPLNISSKDVFPNLYPHEKLSLYGKVTLKKAGCADFTQAVSMQTSSNGLHAQLDCGDLNPAASARAAVPRVNETVEQRLNRIKDLLSKGLISEEEASKARERILNDL